MCHTQGPLYVGLCQQSGDNQHHGIKVGRGVPPPPGDPWPHPPSAALITGWQRWQGRRSIYPDPWQLVALTSSMGNSKAGSILYTACKFTVFQAVVMLESVIAGCCYMTRCWWKTAFAQALLILHYVNVELNVSQLNISYYVVQYMKLPGEKWLPILIQFGYCRNVKDDWTCQQTFFWHLVGIIRSVKNRTDISNWHSSIFSPVLIGNYNSYFHRHVTITIQYLLWGLQSAPCITVDSTSEIFLESFHSWCLILRWYLMHYGQHRDQQQQPVIYISACTEENSLARARVNG